MIFKFLTLNRHRKIIERKPPHTNCGSFWIISYFTSLVGHWVLPKPPLRHLVCVKRILIFGPNQHLHGDIQK